MRYPDDKTPMILASILLQLALLLSGCQRGDEISEPGAMRTLTAVADLQQEPSAIQARSSPQLLPDLVVESISVEWTILDDCFSISDTATFQVSIRVTNIGEADAGTFHFLVNQFRSEDVSSGLRKGETGTYTYDGNSLALDLGKTVWVDVDNENEIIESNEGNNLRAHMISAPESVPPCPSIEPDPCPEPTSIPLFSEDQAITFSELHMIDGLNGWAVSSVEDEDDHILRTEDGGRSWKDVTPPQLSLICELAPLRAARFFLNEEVAWVLYYEPSSGRGIFGSWRTLDGGETWERMSFLQVNTDILGGFFTWPILEFRDSQHGWLLIDYFMGAGSHAAELYRTIDGGRSWELIPEVYLEAYLTHGSGLDFIDDRHGWATSNDPVLVYMGLNVTNDRGHTWHFQELPYPSELLGVNEYDPHSCYVSRPRLRTARIGSVVVECEGDYFLYTSEDGGQSWRGVAIPGGPPQLLDPMTGWTLDGHVSDDLDPDEIRSCDLYKTEDGGYSWTKVTTVDWCGTLNFVSDEVGWALGAIADETAFMHTKDGGRTWERISPLIVSYEVSQERDVTPYLVLPEELQPIGSGNLHQLRILAEVPAKDATRLAFPPEGGALFVTHSDGTISEWELEGVASPSIARIHTDWIYDLDFSLDGDWLATASKSGELELEGIDAYVIPTEDIQTLTMNYGEVTSVAFSPSADILAAGYEDKTIVLWQYSEYGYDSEIRSKLDGHTGWVWDVMYSVDGRTLASGSSDRTVRLWDVERGETLHTLRGHTSTVWRVAFSPDGQVLASASWDGTVSLWDPLSGEELRTLRGHTDWITDIAFAPSGEILATASKDGTVLLWAPDREGPPHTLWKHHSPVNALAFSPGGQLLATVSDDGSLRFWGVEP